MMNVDRIIKHRASIASDLQKARDTLSASLHPTGDPSAAGGSGCATAEARENEIGNPDRVSSTSTCDTTVDDQLDAGSSLASSSNALNSASSPDGSTSSRSVSAYVALFSIFLLFYSNLFCTGAGIGGAPATVVTEGPHLRDLQTTELLVDDEDGFFASAFKHVLRRLNLYSDPVLCSTIPAPDGVAVDPPDCIPCPDQGTCRNGTLVACEAPFVVVKARTCVKDEGIVNRAAHYASLLETELAWMKGRRECLPEGKETVDRSEASEYLREKISDDVWDDAAFALLYAPPNNKTDLARIIPPTLRRDDIRAGTTVFVSTRATVPLLCRAKLLFWHYVPTLLLGLSLLALFLLFLKREARKRWIRETLIREVEKNTKVEPVLQGLSLEDLQLLTGEPDAEKMLVIVEEAERRGKISRDVANGALFFYCQRIADELAPAKEVKVAHGIGARKVQLC
ncbi:unnamed protein product [Amoebophrya sp. A120]|nr:unnamed protein product [Amoebophrya sp. A120]|eukprot:GSA120T00003210001.1